MQEILSGVHTVAAQQPRSGSEFDALLLGDGDPLLRSGKERLQAFVYTHGKASNEEAS